MSALVLLLVNQGREYQFLRLRERQLTAVVNRLPKRVDKVELLFAETLSPDVVSGFLCYPREYSVRVSLGGRLPETYLSSYEMGILCEGEIDSCLGYCVRRVFVEISAPDHCELDVYDPTSNDTELPQACQLGSATHTFLSEWDLIEQPDNPWWNYFVPLFDSKECNLV